MDSPAPRFDHTDAARSPLLEREPFTREGQADVYRTDVGRSPLLERGTQIRCWRDVLRREREWQQSHNAYATDYPMECNP